MQELVMSELGWRELEKKQLRAQDFVMLKFAHTHCAVASLLAANQSEEEVGGFPFDL